MGLAGLCHRPLGEGCTAQNAGLCHRPLGEGCTAQNAGFCYGPLGGGCTAEIAAFCHRPLGEACTAQIAGLCHRPLGEGCTAQIAGLCHRPLGEGCTAQIAGLCHRPLGEGCTAQDAGFASVAPPRRSTPGSPSSCWALEWTFSASCPAQNSRLAYHGVPGQPLGNGYAMRPRLTSTARTGSSLAPERCASIPMRATLCTFTTGS